MGYLVDDVCCPKCLNSLVKNNSHLLCASCGNVGGVIEDIPTFAEEKDIKKWGDYHSKNTISDRISGGGYASETPSEIVSFYTQFIPDDTEKLLDVGGGDGNTSADWAIKNPDAIVWIADLSLRGLEKALKRNISNIRTLCIGADSPMPFKDEYFDTIISIFLVEHLDDETIKKFHAEAFRLLKPGGRIVIATDTKFYDKYIHPVERLIRKGKFISNDPTHINLMDPDAYERKIIKSGFSIYDKSVHYIGGRHIFFRALYSIFPGNIVNRFFSTMFIIVAIKN